MRAQSAAAQVAAIAVGEAAADADARGRATVDGLVQRAASVEHRAPRGVVGDPQGIADLVVAQPAELAHDERAALALGQRAQVLDEL